jgi:SAM-dependent methyltransferase
VRREKCGGCGSPNLRQFLDLGSTPLADDFPTAPDLDAKRWPLGAVVCEACWLVQLTEVVPDDVLWGGDYGFYTGGSPSSVRYFEDYAAELIDRHMDLLVSGLVVEVACNDGTLLQHFARVGCPSVGVEPAKGPAEAARAKCLDVIEAPFGREVAQAIVDTEGQASLVIANNVLAHVADLDDFVGGLALLLAPDGVLSVEVQYLGDLLLGNGFDLLYHEHRSFFSRGSLGRVLARHDLSIAGAAWTPAQGGSLRCEVRHGRRDRLAEPYLNGMAAYSAMQPRVDRVRARLRHLIDAERAAGRTVVGYGAPAKATTLLHWCGLTSSEDIDVVYDATPSKDRRFMPGTDIQIVHAPKLDMGDAHRVTAVMLPHNYAGGIFRREREFLDAGGRFIVPLPVPVLL